MAGPAPVMLMVRELTIGGSERQLTELVRFLDRSRFQPHVGCFRPEGIRSQELRRAGIPVVRFPVRSFRSPSTLAAAMQMGRYLARHRIRIVHTFDTPMNLFGIFAAKVFRTPVALSSQRASRELSSGIERRLLRLTDRLADGIVVNCEAVRNHLIEDEGVQPARIHLCHNGVDTAQFNPSGRSRTPGLRDAGVVVGVVCALRPEKGLHLLLEAFREVRRTRPGLRLVIVGNGASGPGLEELSRRLGVREDCLFEPATDRVADWLRAIDIFVLPSLSEALSNSVIEAMACGCAVIASRVGGNPELVDHGRTGLLFEKGDSGDLARRLAELVDNQVLRHELADAGACFIRENFSIEAAARRMEEIYSASLSGRLCSGTPG